jgi:hypothetical protein
MESPLNNVIITLRPFSALFEYSGDAQYDRHTSMFRIVKSMKRKGYSYPPWRNITKPRKHFKSVLTRLPMNK